jgi:acyl-coenzyme A synthetase/AMP-(fatty) acid ligase
VESALVSDWAMAEAAAIGISDAIEGEAVECFAILRAGHEWDAVPRDWSISSA